VLSPSVWAVSCFNAQMSSSRVHPISYPIGTRSSFPSVKWQGHEADHSLPSSAEVELYLHFPICFHGIVLNLLSIGTTLPSYLLFSIAVFTGLLSLPLTY
jgi:hypothetical protein